MTTLVKLDGRVHEDSYLAVDADDEPLPTDRDVLVSLARWERDREQLGRHPGRVGVRLGSDERPERIAADLAALDLVALEFPAFRDGRAYSYARLLRERFGFAGELRAVGDVLMEQLAFMVRVGFDAFELEADDPEASFRTAVEEMSVWYQPAGDGRATAVELRHGRG